MVFKSANESMGCVRYSSTGIPYDELTCLYPSIRPLYTQWEITFDTHKIYDRMLANPHVPVAATVLYLLAILWGKQFMKDRSALSWRKLLAAWNLGLAIFSFIGASRTLPHLLHNLTVYSLRDVMCNDPESMFGCGPVGVWVGFFVISKIPELFDTFFIIIHKKKLIFLHYYHHLTVLLYCWFSYTMKSPSGIFFGSINYLVHAIMYFYYFLMAMKWRPKWFNPIIITIAQISQMILGIFVTGISVFYYRKENANVENDCWISQENNMTAFIMYGSYLVLFLHFFLGRYYKMSFMKMSRTGAKSIKKIS